MPAIFVSRRLVLQTKAMRHALKLPRLERLVYSTCSIHEVENELVVKAVLDQAQGLGFELVDPFPSWHRRGRPLVHGHQHLIRVGELIYSHSFIHLLALRACAGSSFPAL